MAVSWRHLGGIILVILAVSLWFRDCILWIWVIFLQCFCGILVVSWRYRDFVVVFLLYFDGILVVCSWYFGGIVAGILMVFWQYFDGILAVFSWYLGGIFVVCWRFRDGIYDVFCGILAVF